PSSADSCANTGEALPRIAEMAEASGTAVAMRRVCGVERTRAILRIRLRVMGLTLPQVRSVDSMPRLRAFKTPGWLDTFPIPVPRHPSRARATAHSGANAQ